MSLLADTLNDAHHTLRQLRRNPFFALTVILTLTLTLGATAALTGVLRATLLNPLPYPHASELVTIADHNTRAEPKPEPFTSVLRTGDLQTFAPGGHPLFSSLGYFYADDSTLTVDGHEPIRVPAVAVSGGFFPTLAAKPLLGRTLTMADDLPNGPELLVLSRTLWQTAFAADPNIIGRTVRLGAAQATIVGVMDSSFTYPAGVELWHPGHILPSSFGGYRGDGSRWLQVVARLQPGGTVLQAQAQAGQLAQNLARQYPATDATWTFRLVSFRDSLFGQYRQALTLLAIAVGLVLLIASVNIAGLQLSRNAARQPEFTVRTALGVSRSRLIRQLLTESILLTLTGCVAGLALASALLPLLASRLPAALVQAQAPRVDILTLVFCFSVAVLVGVLTAILPALESVSSSTSQRTVVGAGAGRTRLFGSGFTVLQIALSLVLLGISTAVLSSLYALVSTPLGFTSGGIETFTVDLPWGNFGEKSHQLYASLEQQFATLPGVTSAGAVTALPLTGVYSFRNTLDIAGQPPTPQHDTVVAEGRIYSPGYLHTMQIPLLAGRNFTAHDSTAGLPPVLLVNQTFAHKYFPQGALGKHLIGPVGVQGALADAGEIVGITGDVRGNAGTLAQPVQPEVYFPESGAWPHLQFALRTTQTLGQHNPDLERQVRRMVQNAGLNASAGHFAPLTFTIEKTLAQPRLNASLLTAFAALSLLLVVIGVYGLVAFDVAQRTRELGLRMALGSTRAGILTLLLRQSTRLLVLGLAIGLAVTFAASRVLASLLPGAAQQSLLLTLATTVTLAFAVLAATYLPARRAAHTDPMQALKT